MGNAQFLHLLHPSITVMFLRFGGYIYHLAVQCMLSSHGSFNVIWDSNGTCITIDSICMNNSSSQCSIKPAINGLADHIAHLLVLTNIQTLFTNYKHDKQTTI